MVSGSEEAEGVLPLHQVLYPPILFYFAFFLLALGKIRFNQRHGSKHFLSFTAKSILYHVVKLSHIPPRMRSDGPVLVTSSEIGRTCWLNHRSEL